MIGFLIVGVQAKRLDMVNFEGFVEVGFMQPAALANAIVALVCLFALCFPIWAVIVAVAAAPTVAVLAHHVLRLPFAHAITAAKVMLFYVSVLARKFCSAVVASNDLAFPTQQDAFALVAARNGFGLLQSLGQSVWFGIEGFGAYGADSVSHLLFSVGFLAIVCAKPKPRFVTFDEAISTLNLLLTVGTMNFHRCIIAYLNEYSKLRRWATATSQTPVRVG